MEQDYRSRLEYMEKTNEVLKWESSAKILIYLKIFGPLKAIELKEKLGLKGEKSVFNSLKPLIDNGFVEKEDKARNALYFPTNKFVTDPEFDEGFIKYLIGKNRYELLAEYLTNANKSSVAFMNVLTDIMKNNLENNNNPSIIANFIENSFFIEMIFSTKDVSLINKKFNKFFTDELHPLIDHTDNLSQEPMKNPAGLFISFIPLSIEKEK